MRKHPNGRGSLWVDRVFGDVGRIHRATGTTDRGTARLIDAMLLQLYAQGRLDVLRALRDKKVSFLEVYSDWRIGGAAQLPSAANLGAVLPRWEKWAAGRAEEHRRVASKWARKVLVAHLPPAAAIRALPEAAREIQVTFASKPRSANLMRSLILAFLRDVAGRANPLYQEVSSLRLLKVPRKTAPKMTLADIREAATAVGPNLAPIVWALALTGMRPKEMWVTPWKAMPDRVRIEGSKSGGSFRDVPLLGSISKPTVARVTFRKHFKAKFPQWRVYDLRHAYAGILEEAGVPRARRLLYMGRGPKDVQDLYEFREVSEYLAADAERILVHIQGHGGMRPTLKIVGNK